MEKDKSDEIVRNDIESLGTDIAIEDMLDNESVLLEAWNLLQDDIAAVPDDK